MKKSRNSPQKRYFRIPTQITRTLKRDKKQVHNLLSKISKCIYNKLNQSPLQTLAKSTFNPQFHLTADNSNKTKQQSELNKLVVYLKQQHNNNNRDTKIIQLPKQPWGHHQSYNQDKLFIGSHFISDSLVCNTEQKKQLSALAMKFKLAKKRIQQQKCSSKDSRRKFKSSSEYFDIHPMAAGNLICTKQYRVHSSYENETSTRSVSVEKNRGQNNQKFLRKLHREERKSSTKEVVGRLYSSAKKEYKSRLARGLVNKYSTLSEWCEEEIRRPATAVPWKGESPFKKISLFG